MTEPSDEEIEAYEKLKHNDDLDENMRHFVWLKSHRDVSIEEIEAGPDYLITQVTAKLNRKNSGAGPAREDDESGEPPVRRKA